MVLHHLEPIELDGEEFTFTYYGGVHNFLWRGPGISLFFPGADCSLQLTFSVKTVNDDYVLPLEYQEMPLVSGMYEIIASDKLPAPATMQIQHCAIIDEEDSLIFMVAHGKPPYHFEPLPGGRFPLGESYGEVKIDKFCKFMILYRNLRGSMSLSAHVFYHTNITATFVVTKNVEALIAAVKKKYVRVNYSEWSMSCNNTTKAIVLTMPDCESGEWSIEPEIKPPKIETRLIRKYREGKTPPSVKLNMRWTGDGKPRKKYVEIKMKGASLESFTLYCKPSSDSDASFSPSASSHSHSLPRQAPSPTPSQPSSLSSLTDTATQPMLEMFPAPSQSYPFPSQSAALKPSGPAAKDPSTYSLSDSATLGRPSVGTHSPQLQATRTPQSIALQKSYSIFKKSLHPANLMTVLYSNCLLTREEKDKARQETNTDDQKLEEIFQGLERRVSADPVVFNKVIKALKEEPVTEKVGGIMQAIYEECADVQEKR
jgi:hypothetical protein